MSEQQRQFIRPALSTTTLALMKNPWKTGGCRLVAFGLAASSFFPAIILGIFYKRFNREGAIAGMIGISMVRPSP